ncbi:oligosaccharide flippase family protein [Mariprofundus ferrooxydans]|uniref:oligosaccharide flippase family protein n=1 Tax=Mariprofundus ferrooxydans TaxID=314344 RepID=UPI0023EDE56A|nr:oligosaccharide flippase family protein [Mariprofundus ferrooxydans]
MSLLRANIVANLIGSGWTAVISIAFIPLYIHFMGVESYGLVGFYLTLQALSAVLDMGLTTTLSRELARMSALTDCVQEMRNLVRTLEIVYWSIAVLIMVVVTLLAPWLATEWLNVRALPVETVQLAIVLMGLIVALRMPYGFYSGGLIGLQRQVLLNGIKITAETVKSGGTVMVLWLVSPEITAFFLWQLLISAIGACAVAVALWKSLPESGTAALFQLSVFRRVWRFTAGMSLITILSAILAQMDKIILSKMLSLEVFAYYSLAASVAVGIYVIAGPVFSAVYPRLTQLLTSNDMSELRRLYHKSCQLMTIMVIPPALAVSFFSLQLLNLWTQNEQVSSHASPILTILVLGTALNAMMNIPFALQLAHGWIRLALSLNVVAILVLVPALIFAVTHYGSTGAAMIWLFLNAVSVFCGLQLMHKKILPGEFRTWLVTDFGMPVLVSVCVIGFFWLTMPENIGPSGQLLWIVIASIGGWLVSAWIAPDIRQSILARIHAGHWRDHEFTKTKV